MHTKDIELSQEQTAPHTPVLPHILLSALGQIIKTTGGILLKPFTQNVSVEENTLEYEPYE